MTGVFPFLFFSRTVSKEGVFFKKVLMSVSQKSPKKGFLTRFFTKKTNQNVSLHPCQDYGLVYFSVVGSEGGTVDCR